MTDVNLQAIVQTNGTSSAVGISIIVLILITLILIFNVMFSNRK